MEDIRYPVGKFQYSGPLSAEQRKAAIDEIASVPARLRKAVAGMSEQQLDTPYREGGWTVRQTIHHLADSHLNSYIRFRQAITEDVPTIKPYDEAVWAELPDAKSAPVEASLDLLDGMTQRWVMLLRSFNDAQWKRKFNHPERGEMTVDMNLALYEWHGRHHLAHITNLAQRNGWKQAGARA